ncbi:uncharacterized protein TrAtP1_006618 [Trichoderma atroviride]|uniref:DUF4219 domain-containing protein n=1 Tax=Hypocrea atroviridis (strain ATCC 20476 / IMI 206040) TaxID=452589 RepID=G9PBV5_HYPAI|nr:uncharacterized protein TRIATDRAFT_303113 [Trichoderma atroviride IMI 206040]EHK39849.1 hypothetical protein TRIATDRAFT_303113 [Trichoderma atroviride IMI 206040]UKZ65422.1 hypothetical protein TrAtP1_006618 [Trichoderma atroviride]
MSNFNFKLDPACLPQLTSKGDNYSEWRPAWQIAYEWAELWETIEDKPPTLTPTTTTTSADTTQTTVDATALTDSRHRRRNDSRYVKMPISTTDIIMSVCLIDMAICAILTAYRTYVLPPPPPAGLQALQDDLEELGGGLHELVARVTRLESGEVPQVQAPVVAPIPAPSSNTANGTQ